MAEKRDIKEQLTAADSAGLEQERQKAKKQAARAKTQKFRYERALYMLAEQSAVDLFARCVAVFAGMGRLWAVPRSNEAEPRIVAEAKAMAEEAKSLATHEGRDGFSVTERGDGECYLLVNVLFGGSYAATVESGSRVLVPGQPRLSRRTPGGDPYLQAPLMGDAARLTAAEPTGPGLRHQRGGPSVELTPAGQRYWPATRRVRRRRCCHRGGPSRTRRQSIDIRGLLPVSLKSSPGFWPVET